MILEVDIGGPVPPYEQIRAQIAELAASGALAEGSRLPTIRQLESDGVVRSRVRHGTTVTPMPKPSRKEATARLANAARAYARAVTALGLSREQAIAELDRQFGDLR
jgi:DNA-binding transcriptional regulator YhcF (GntR family)